MGGLRGIRKFCDVICINTSLQTAMTTIEERKADVSEDELTKVFNELDDDGNGFITPREAKKAYRKLADKFNIPRVMSISVKVEHD